MYASNIYIYNIYMYLYTRTCGYMCTITKNAVLNVRAKPDNLAKAQTTSRR